jgi:hypothetical protein
LSVSAADRRSAGVFGGFADRLFRERGAVKKLREGVRSTVRTKRTRREALRKNVVTLSPFPQPVVLRETGA